MLGAGRLKKENTVDHTAGITINKKPGDFVKSGETLVKIHFTNCENPDNIKKMIKLSYNISDVKPDKVNLFKDIIT
jgi:thymidine phosphorylase